MAKVLVTESNLTAIANAIRGRNGSSDTYTPAQMADAVTAIPNSYVAGDEGKVVDNGALVSQSSLSVTENGTYDTTKKNSVTVNVSGGGGYFNRLTPIHTDLVGGYIGGNTWNVGDTSARTDVYQVEAGKAYLAVSGPNHGNRFRCSFFSTDPAQATGNLSGYELYPNNDNPTNYNIAANMSSGVLSLYVPSANGYIGIGKTNQSIDGLNSYLFEVNI